MRDRQRPDDSNPHKQSPQEFNVRYRRGDRYDADDSGYDDEFDEFEDENEEGYATGYDAPPPDLETRAPRVPRWRRGCAFAVDCACAGLFATLLSGGSAIGQFVTFNFCWLAIRAVITSGNYGQSVGRWLFDMRVINLRYQRTPLLGDLFKREAIAGNAALFAYLGFLSLGSQNAFYLLFLVPLVLDLGAAWLEPTDPSAFHDRVAKTAVVATRRGYSLDLKVKKWVAFGMANMKR